MFALNHKVSLYVCQIGQVESVALAMSKLYGGATCQKATGYWVDNDGKLWEDPTTIVTSYASEQPKVSDVEAMVREIFLNSRELAVSVEYASGLVIYDRSDMLSVAEMAA